MKEEDGLPAGGAITATSERVQRWPSNLTCVSVSVREGRIQSPNLTGSCSVSVSVKYFLLNVESGVGEAGCACLNEAALLVKGMIFHPACSLLFALQ